MPKIEFESVGASLSRIPDVIRSIPDIIRNPAANPIQSAILLAIGLIFVLIVLLTLALLLLRPDREVLFDQELAEEAEPPSDEELVEIEATERTERVERRLSRVSIVSIAIIVVAVVWIATGITTSSPQMCNSCHPVTSHTTAAVKDPHADVSCVDCHESGGTLARLTVNVVARAQHVILARAQSSAAAEFGAPVSSDRCFACHRDQMRATSFDANLGVKVSHKEPLAAGAECVDCHQLKDGVVSSWTVGMSTCLRCHDGKKAKVECKECHVGDPSRAIRPSTSPNKMAGQQVPNPQCNGCHTDMTTCNRCHGISMPHTEAFKFGGHAREAAIDIWNGKLSICRKCHYPGHRDCLREGCHVGQFPSHPLTWRRIHALSPWSRWNAGCDCHGWNPYEHNGEFFCQICHAVKPKGARTK